MHTLRVTLKQHTPLIHFQHDQDDATLRASEVKPKLDKFILSQLTPEQRAQGEREGWIKTKNDKVWLDYKMRIVAERPKQIEMNVIEKKEHGRQLYDEIGRALFTTHNYPDNSNSLIMGNMGGRVKEDVLNFVMFENNTLIFNIKQESLVNEIRSSIFTFFSETNFGNRTSKGFGSYLVEKIDGILCDKEPQYDWKISFSLFPEQGDRITNNRAIKDVFVVINRVWKGLKKYSNAPKNQLKSVFLNVDSDLTNNEDRIPSPVYFKPIVKTKSNEEWEVDILVFLNADVILAANADFDDFYNLLDNAVAYANNNKTDDYKNNYYVSNITIE